MGGLVALTADARSPAPPAAIRAILEREGFTVAELDFERAQAHADTGAEHVAVVLWLADPARDLADALECLTARFPSTPLIVACPSVERRQLRAALTAGVAGVVVAEELDGGLGACVRAVCAGQLCVPRAHWREIEPPVLSVRERQVLGLVAMGYMNRQIADRLYLAESTVKSHLSSAFGKLGVRSRSEAAELVLNRERGLDVGIAQLRESQPAGIEATLAH